MNNHKVLPNKLPLILILLGTTLLAIPAAFGTAALLDTSSPQYPGVRNIAGQILLCISIVGFVLFAGYILTAIFRRHSGIFWLCSTLYNFALSCCYLYAFVSGVDYNPVETVRLAWFSFPYSLILPWTIFVTAASGYYCRASAFRAKSLDLS